MISVIPAAGKGTRFKELGKQYSKTILPYREKPLLIHQIEWLEKQGSDDIRVVINHQEETVKEILSLYNKNVTLVRQEEQNGLSGAIFCALNPQDKDNVLILLGDLVPNEDLIQGSLSTDFISVQKVPDYSRWCMVETKEGKAKTFIDKPQEKPDTDLAVSGVYHILNSKKLYDLLNEQLKGSDTIKGEYQISSVLQKIADEYMLNIINLDLIDFGTLEEYLQNRSVKISRSFNDIKVDGSFIFKSSEKEGEKLIKEYNWFNNLPGEVKVHTPRMFSHNFFPDKNLRVYYKMEKILAPSLREIYLFLDSSTETWQGIFNSMFELLDTMEDYGRPNKFMESVVDKTKSRVKNISIPVENLLISDFIEDLASSVYSEEFRRPSLMHGDFCFSNLLYDFQGSSIKMIDPRGELFGDHYYEVAKICHSALWDYDFVDAELYVQENGEFKIYNNGKWDIKDLFISILEDKYNEQEIRYIKLLTASLFLSMIPLHSHNINNQKLYYRIFKDIYSVVDTRSYFENI
jgi:dTDP-glucose pyrophosphorylase